MLDSSYQRFKRLLVFTYDEADNNKVTADSHQKNFLSRVGIKNYNIEIHRRHFYDQPINDLIKQHY